MKYEVEFPEPLGDDAVVVVVIRHLMHPPTVVSFAINEATLLEGNADVWKNYVVGRLRSEVKQAMQGEGFL